MPASRVVGNLYLGDASSSMAPDVHAYDLVVNVTREVPFSKCLDPFQAVARFDILDDERSDQAAMAVACREAVKLIDVALSAGKVVLCHCLEGKQRSAAVAAAYLILTLQMDPDEAVAHVRRVRPAAWDHGQYVHYREALDLVAVRPALSSRS